MTTSMDAAHTSVTPDEVWASWTWEPAVIVGLVVTGWLFGRGVRRLWAAGRGRGVGVRRVTAFYAGLVVVAIALLSPLDGLGATLFSAHMAQHLVLILVAAPLVVYGDPRAAFMLAVPAGARRPLRSLGRAPAIHGIGAILTVPIAALIVHAAALWAWHSPALYTAALTNKWAHAAEHLSFFVTALLFWSVVLPASLRPRPRYGPRIMFVFANALQSGALGAIILFSTTVLYPVHEAGVRAWGLTALEDQQLAGAIMWIPAGAVYFVLMAALFLRWLKDMDRRSEAADSSGRGPVATDG